MNKFLSPNNKLLAQNLSPKLIYSLNPRLFHILNSPKHLKSNSFISFNRKFIGMQPPDFDPNKDYYKILGVPPSANEKDIKATYYKLA
jgi:hypothetical protein